MTRERIDPVTRRYLDPAPRDPLTLRSVVLSIGLLINPTTALVRRAAAPQPKEKNMSTHRTAKRPFSRMTDGEKHPVIVRHVGTPAYYRDTETDPHLWDASAASVIAEAMTRTENPEPQRVPVETIAVVAHVDLDAPALPRSAKFEGERNRRAGIPVPQMDRMHPIGHVDAMANTHGDDR